METDSFFGFSDRLRRNLSPRVDPELRAARSGLLRRMAIGLLVALGLWAVALLASTALGYDLTFASYSVRLAILLIATLLCLRVLDRGNLNTAAYLLASAVFLHGAVSGYLAPEHVVRTNLVLMIPVLIAGAVIGAWSAPLFGALGIVASVGLTLRAQGVAPVFLNDFWMVSYLAVQGAVLLAIAGVTRSLSEQIRAMGGSFTRQADQMSKLAYTDPLTGLANRRHLFEQLESEFERARRYRRPFCLLYVDLDGFKAINDRFGHLFGDEILRGSAVAMQGVLRTTDLLARVGGDEFAVLLPETKLRGAEAVAAKLRKALAAYGGQLSPSLETLTLSVGVGEISEDDDAIEDILARADKAQYLAKSSGKSLTRTQEDLAAAEQL